jgi:hypothetical protein
MKYFLTSILFIVLSYTADAQAYITAEVNQSMATASAHNLPYYSWATLTYEWTFTHVDSNTSWTYHTTQASKSFQIFYEGDYLVRCRIKYLKYNSYNNTYKYYGYMDLFTQFSYYE